VLEHTLSSQGISVQIIAFGADEQRIRNITKDMADFQSGISKVTLSCILGFD
jgi:hypothetical protein